jgi:hypothetical protein
MHPDVLALDQPGIRGADSNSLLRMYDEARGLSARSASPKERARANRAVERIARELAKRKLAP